MSRDVAYPIQGALYHPPGAVIRHDAVVWGYARRADAGGVHIHQGVEVTGHRRSRTAAASASRRTRARSRAGIVMSAVAGWTTQITDMAGIETPITNHPLQAFVTEPVKPMLHKIIVSAGPARVRLADRPRRVPDRRGDRAVHDVQHALDVHVHASTRRANALELVPFLARLKILRQWTGYCDMTPDYSPIMGETEVDGFYVDAGWGTWGFKASPICGVTMAEMVATGKTPDADRAVRARALPRRHARAREGRGGRLALAALRET